MENNEIYDRGAMPPTVESFEIVNLHGYKTITLSLPHAATILIAQNGAGKTTLLNALDAFLKGQFLRLKNLHFSEIRCRLYGREELLVVSSDDIQRIADASIDNEIILFAKRIQIEPRVLSHFLLNSFGIFRDDMDSLADDPIFDAVVRIFDWNRKQALDYLEKLQALLFSSNPHITDAISMIRSALKGFEVLYLPTYRRIESPLAPDKDDENVYRRRRGRYKNPFGLFSGDMQFGLSDISERLSELNQQILYESNRGYRKLSADIIKELLDGSFDRAELSEFYIPTSDEMNLFFSRLKEGRRIGPFGEVVIPDIDHLLNANHPTSETNRFLLYFISKLSSVMQATKGIENQVEEFITRCNKYLSNFDVGYGPPVENSVARLDSKELRLNRANMSVYAVSLPSERKIALDALSSGEKQMISLLAKLYLYPKQKIVLIDEPELSLSIDWQRQILADIVSAPTCNQLVAITHSPFVFDNALDPFARSLKVSIDQDRIPRDFDGDEHDGEVA